MAHLFDVHGNPANMENVHNLKIIITDPEEKKVGSKKTKEVITALPFICLEKYRAKPFSCYATFS